eukprot:GSChrysophyteH1.ASY1.ANO1.1606.1 assembled CDS
MQLYSDIDLLSASLQTLIDTDERRQARAAIDIRSHLEAAARELSLVRFANFENELYSSIFLNIVSGDTISEKLGGVLAIRELILCTSAAAEQKVITFANTLSNALKVNTDYKLIELAAVALGDMARSSPVAQVDYVETELDQALDWMRESQAHAHRRFAACAVLQQLAENAPTVFFVRTKEFFDLIWKPLRDHKEKIRKSAGAALSACLAVLRQRTYHLQWYCNIYEQIHEGFRKGTTECVHGSLIVVAEMLKHTGDFMIPRFKEISKAIIALREHRSSVVKGALLALLPELAQFCPEAFARTYLDESVEIVVKFSKIGELRQQALLSTGHLCRAVGPYLAPRAEEMLSIVTDALTGNSRKKLASEALRCISDMVQGLGVPFHPKVLLLLDPMLQSGLTDELIDTLSVISESMPNQRPEVQQRLLEEATKVLGGDPKPRLPQPAYLYSWAHSGQRRSQGGGQWSYTSLLPQQPRDQGGRGMISSLRKGLSYLGLKRSSTNNSSNSSNGRSSPAVGVGSMSQLDMTQSDSQGAPQSQSVKAAVNNSPELVLLSLRTLGNLSLSKSHVIVLVNESVLPYLASTDTLVRQEAAKTCAKMAAFVSQPFQCRGPTAEATEVVISRLISVMISDPTSRVRLSVLKALSSHFDRYLCRTHHIEALQFLLSDENYEIRGETLKILGRLTRVNPAAVLPSLRLLLIRLISEIKNSSESRLKEDATLLMCTFMRVMPLQALLKPFVPVLIRTFPLSNNTESTDVRLATSGLEAIGELCKVMRQDQEASIKTLGSLVSATGRVVTPYLQYPQLLPRALDLLFNKANVPWSLRREVLRTTGLLGALEPYKYSLIQSQLNDVDRIEDGWRGPKGLEESKKLMGGREASHLTSLMDLTVDRPGYNLDDLITSEDLLDDVNISGKPAHLFINEDYYPRVAVTALMRILRDPAQAVHHSSVTQAIMQIFKSLGMMCVPFLDQIVPYLLQLIRRCNPGLRESLLQQMSQLASIVQYHLIPFLPDLFEIIQDYWVIHLEHILQLVEDVAATATDAFGAYVTTVLPLLLSSLVVPRDVNAEVMRIPLEKTLSCHDALRSTLRPHMHLVVPAFCKLIVQLQEIGPDGFRGGVVEQSHVVSTRIMHTLTKTIIRAHEQGISKHSKLFKECLGTICRVGRQLGSRLEVFDGLILRSIEGRGLDTTQYRELSAQLRSGTLMQFTFADREDLALNAGKQGNFMTGQQKMTINQSQLARSWDVSQRSTAVDWNEWLRRLKVELLRESPSPVLRACSALAQAHVPLAHDLFHAAFVSCWNELSDQYRESLVRALQAAFRSTTIPPEILQTLLNLAEFMEHDVEPLPINTPILAELAEKSHAYAKALHYRELEFQTSPATCFESLININKKLDQYDAAMGVLKVVGQLRTKHPELSESYKVQEAWLAKLGHWDDALVGYETKLEENPRDASAIAGKLKCLDALGRWEEAIKICNSTLDLLRNSPHTKAAVIGARAAWSLNAWDLMDTFVSQLSEDNIDACFMRAILAVHAEDYEASKKFIDVTREKLDTSVSTLLTESYGRAYVPLIMVQQCSELEEITDYKMLLLQTSIQVGLQQEVRRRKLLLADKWKKRIHGCASSGRSAIPLWKYLLNGRRMVLNFQENFDTWIEFATLCRHCGNNALAERVLGMSHSLLEQKGEAEGISSVETKMRDTMRLAMLKQDWENPLKRGQCVVLLEDLIKKLSQTTHNDVLLECLLKLGEWKLSLVEPGIVIDKSTRRDVLALYGRATMVEPQSYRAWHQWGLSNYRAIEEATNRGSSDPKVVAPLAVNATKGLLRAISLGVHQWTSSITQDMLCVLSIWFRFGRLPDVCAALESGLSSVHLDNWLGVLPQLIARIDHPDPTSRGLLHSLLKRLGTRHSQALVYPLAVALKSPKEERKEAADVLMQSIRQHSVKIIDQALMVSQELVRVAILWQEEWHESLEEASRQYFGDGNVVAMLETLQPLQAALQNGPNTMREMSFVNAYGKDLNDAWDCIEKYKAITESSILTQAWDLYYSVFKRINATLPHVTTLELQFCSPALMSARDLDLGVPGTYTVQGKAVRHEDLRQDERAMQLFGLVNALLFHNRRTSTGHDLSIQRYAVLPLSPTAGLISWVPNCDTLHDLIRDYRESKKMMLNWEHKLMQQVAPNQTYETLPFAHKLEVFEHALANTPGEDLAKILWLKSDSSERWLERRAMYTRSLAVMSMVGYVLGLGDRHPSNLMLDRKTGKVLHIDFGDCFEVAMQRDKYPEKVPFRLTRMLVNAMEVSGIEGNYRRTCEKVMYVLRENRDSLIATLEAFVHDPLISWRLLNTAADKKAVKKGPEATGSGAATGSTGASENATSKDSSLVAPTSKHQLGVNMEMPESPIITDGIAGLEKALGSDVAETRSTGSNAIVATANPSEATKDSPGIAATKSPLPPDSPSRVSSDSPVAGDPDTGAAIKPDCFSGAPVKPKRASVSTLEAQVIVEHGEEDEEEGEAGTPAALKTGMTDQAADATDSTHLETPSQSKLGEADLTNQGKEGATTAAPPGWRLGLAESPSKEQMDTQVEREQGGDGVANPSGKKKAEEKEVDGNEAVDLHVAMSKLSESATSFHDPNRATHSLSEELTLKALVVIRRVMDKLTGLDFANGGHAAALDVPEQVDRLIRQATANENLCLSYFGWCPFW